MRTNVRTQRFAVKPLRIAPSLSRSAAGSRACSVSTAGAIATFRLVVRFVGATFIDQPDQACVAQLLQGLPWSQCEQLPDELLTEVARVAVVHIQLDAADAVPWQHELLAAMARRLPLFACCWIALPLPASVVAALFQLHASHNQPSACFFGLLDEFVTSADAAISWRPLVVDVLTLWAAARESHDRLLALLLQLTPPQDLPGMLHQYAGVPCGAAIAFPR
jgi:hypothetical protein